MVGSLHLRLSGTLWPGGRLWWLFFCAWDWRQRELARALLVQEGHALPQRHELPTAHVLPQSWAHKYKLREVHHFLVRCGGEIVGVGRYTFDPPHLRHLGHLHRCSVDSKSKAGGQRD